MLFPANLLASSEKIKIKAKVNKTGKYKPEKKSKLQKGKRSK